MYNKDNIEGIEFNIGGTSSYKIKYIDGEFRIYSGLPYFTNDCGLHSISIREILSSLEKGYWIPTNFPILNHYEIY